jgi:hypothetical protein
VPPQIEDHPLAAPRERIALEAGERGVNREERHKNPDRRPHRTPIRDGLDHRSNRQRLRERRQRGQHPEPKRDRDHAALRPGERKQLPDVGPRVVHAPLSLLRNPNHPVAPQANSSAVSLPRQS